MRRGVSERCCSSRSLQGRPQAGGGQGFALSPGVKTYVSVEFCAQHSGCAVSKYLATGGARNGVKTVFYDKKLGIFWIG